MPPKPGPIHLLACTLSVGAGFIYWPSPSLAGPEGTPPPLMLANVYEGTEVELEDFWVSEKYDGIRAYWNGEQLLTRNGNQIHAPHWYTAGWPSTALDGELWIDRGKFEWLIATVLDDTPDELAWREVRFMAFDLPAHAGPFRERMAALKILLAESDVEWIYPVEHWQAPDERTLERQLTDVIGAGGEGLMLRRGSSLYRAERSDDLLKLKRYRDAEAQVVGYIPGKGKYERMLGALEVRHEDGTTFRIGTGFNDAQRSDPPAIGSWITYRYHGLTARGIPRFASFVRVREEE